MFEVLPELVSIVSRIDINLIDTHARTLENSEDGDMTKLSFELDHEIRCWML